VSKRDRTGRKGRAFDDLDAVPAHFREECGYPYGARPRAHENGSVKTVLIVDDHPSFRASARLLLEAEGFAVVGEAEDGAQAVRLAHELRPDVVLLDVQLPDRDGFAVIPDLGVDGHVPCVVLVSSRDECDYGSLIGDSGACGFIAKAELSGPGLAAFAV
jgi:CheY-like chemotaxis protein